MYSYELENYYETDFPEELQKSIIIILLND